MKGSLRERQGGNWELIVQLPRDPETGLRKQLSRTHYGTKREAQRALAALVALRSDAGRSSRTTSMWLGSSRRTRRVVPTLIRRGFTSASGDLGEGADRRRPLVPAIPTTFPR